MLFTTPIVVRDPDLADDPVAIDVNADPPRCRALRVAALGGLGFDLLYVIHRLLQGLGPQTSTVAAITPWASSPRLPRPLWSAWLTATNRQLYLP
jgi:hypothetical protein